LRTAKKKRKNESHLLPFVNEFPILFLLVHSLIALWRVSLGNMLRPKEEPIAVGLRAELSEPFLILGVEELRYTLPEPSELLRGGPKSWRHNSWFGKKKKKKKTTCDMFWVVCGYTGSYRGAVQRFGKCHRRSHYQMLSRFIY
jgi:hypothetical protein